MADELPGHSTPVSPEWQTEWRRGGGALVIAGLLIAGTWVSASQQSVVLPNGRLIHPSPWGAVVIGCGICVLIGTYIILATVYENWWMPGRRYTPVDHSTRYSLWFQSLAIAFTIVPGTPETISARVAIILKNGGNAGPITATIENMDVQINDIAPAVGPPQSNTMRLLPSHMKQFRSNWIPGLPEGNMPGKLSIEITYGPPIGFPRYKYTYQLGFPRYKYTYQLNFFETAPITMAGIRDGSIRSADIDWTDITPERDEVLEG